MPDKTTRTSCARWVKLGGALPVIAATEIASGHMHAGFAAILIVAALTAVLMIVVGAVFIIAHSTERTWERIFRLLRWFANRPEPPPPSH